MSFAFRELLLFAAHIFDELSGLARFTEDTSSHACYVLGEVRDQYGMRWMRGEADFRHIGSKLLSDVQHA